MATIRQALWVPVLFVASFAAAQAVRRTAVTREAPAIERSPSRQVVAILMMSPDCPYSEARLLRASWNRLLDVLEKGVAGHDASVHTIGASIDIDPERAFAALRDLGPFDEFAVGGGWLNTSVLRYMIRDHAGFVSVPQVVIVMRHVERAPLPDAHGDSVIVRLYGSTDVERWISRHRSWQVASTTSNHP